MIPFSLTRTLGKETFNVSVLQMEGSGLSVPRGDMEMVWERQGEIATEWLAFGADLFLNSRGRSRERTGTLSVSLLSLLGFPIWRDALWWRPSWHWTYFCKHTLLSARGTVLFSFSLVFSVLLFFPLSLSPPLPLPPLSFVSSQRSVHSRDSLFKNNYIGFTRKVDRGLQFSVLW